MDNNILGTITIHQWIDVNKEMPKEHASFFAKYYGTDRWNKHMWRTCSNSVLATVELEDGNRRVIESRTLDGKWHIKNGNVIKQKVIAWTHMPAPYEGDKYE